MVFGRVTLELRIMGPIMGLCHSAIVPKRSSLSIREFGGVSSQLPSWRGHRQRHRGERSVDLSGSRLASA